MASVVFSTPGLIPIESFTVMGINYKPMSSSPLGYFGTGLKYAIAVLLRHKQEVVIWRGQDKYTFYTKSIDFRGKDFDQIMMKVEQWFPFKALLGRPKYHKLPFTTELGKNWELWQAFRELETNTRDENGETAVWNEHPLTKTLHELLEQSFGPNHSHIIVTGQRFVDEYHDRHKNFLEDGLSERTGVEDIQIIPRPSSHVYYRGMRIMDLKEEAANTYNFLRHVELTEDRTAKYPWLLESYIADAIMRSEEPAFVRPLIPSVGYVGPARYEHKINYGISSATPSPVFLEAAKDSSNAQIKDIWNKAQPTIPTSTTIWVTIPTSLMEEGELIRLAAAVESEFPAAVLKTSTGQKFDSRGYMDEVMF